MNANASAALTVRLMVNEKLGCGGSERVPRQGGGDRANRRFSKECLTLNILRAKGRLVWDLPVRVAHWLLVLAVAGSWISAKAAASRFAVHEFFGYTVLVLSLFRVVWGIVGTRYARFTQFLRGPRAVAAHVRKLLACSGEAPSVGHNPLGGWSALCLLLLLAAQAGTGLFANDDVDHVGPFFGWVSLSWSNSSTRLHHVIFSVLQVFVLAHVCAVALYLVVRREDLLTPMFSGRKPSSLVPDHAEIPSSRLVLALAIVAALIVALALAIRAAPEASLSIF